MDKDRKGLLDAVDELTEKRKRKPASDEKDPEPAKKGGREDLDLDSIWS